MIVAAIKAGFTHLDGTTVLLPSPQPTIQSISSHPAHPHLSSRPSLRERRLPRRRHSRLGRPALPTLHHHQIPRTRPGAVAQITPAGPAQEAEGRLRRPLLDTYTRGIQERGRVEEVVDGGGGAEEGGLDEEYWRFEL